MDLLHLDLDNRRSRALNTAFLLIVLVAVVASASVEPAVIGGLSAIILGWTQLPST
jgi:hypothetical protein